MASSVQTLKIKCPHCGWIRSVNIDVDDQGAVVVRGLIKDKATEFFKHIDDYVKDSQLAEANAWSDLPACPHCLKAYQYNVKTNEVRK